MPSRLTACAHSTVGGRQWDDVVTSWGCRDGCVVGYGRSLVVWACWIGNWSDCRDDSSVGDMIANTTHTHLLVNLAIPCS